MGLDMYAFTVPADVAGDTQVDFVVSDEQGNTVVKTDELFYWRKFNALHGWMRSLYYTKGGMNDTFNCDTVRLTLEDLDKLERETAKLSPVEGFFFGELEIYPEDLATVPVFIEKARQAINVEGKAVFYDSWW
jgi:hypothetical protein